MASRGRLLWTQYQQTHERPADNTGTGGSRGRELWEEYKASHTQPEDRVPAAPVQTLPEVQKGGTETVSAPPVSKQKFSGAANAAVRTTAQAFQPREGMTEADYYAQMAEDAEKALADYLASEEYQQNKAAAYQKYNAEHKWDGLKNALMNPTSAADALPAGIADAEELTDTRERELKALADYYRNLEKASKDQATLDADIQEYQSWPKEDQAALQVYIINSNQQFWRTEPSFDNARFTASALFEKYGADRVKEMAESYKRWENAKNAQEVAQTAQEYAQDHPVLGALAARAGNLVGSMTGTMGYLQEMTERTGRYATMDPNNVGNLPSDYAKAVDQKIADNLRGGEHEGITWGDAKATLYQAGMSAADSLARMVAGNGYGSLALAATGSFSQTVQQVSMQGGSPAQAVAMGVVNGGMEVLTEKLPLDNLLDQAKGGYKTLGKAIKDALIAGGIEVTEEELSFLGSTLAEAAILRENSGYNQQIQALVAEGMSYEEARDQADRALVNEAAQTAVQSFLSGGMMSGTTSAVSSVLNRNQTGQGQKGKRSHKQSGALDQEQQAEMDALAQEEFEQAAGRDQQAAESSEEAEEAPVSAMEDMADRLMPVQSAVTAYRQSGTVSNRMAEIILGKSGAVAELEASSGVEITGTKSQQRQAVRDAVASLAAQQDAAKTQEAQTPEAIKARQWAEASRETMGMSGQSDAAPAETNAVSNPLESYPAEKQNMIRSYIQAVDGKIKSFVERVKSGDLTFKRQKISDVSTRAAGDIGRILGIDVSGYTHNINTNGVKHILFRHGENGEHDSTMAQDADISRVGWVLENYDSVEPMRENGEQVYSSEFRDKNDRPAPQVRFVKKIDGSYYVVEAACENRYKKLWVQSVYLQKNNGDVTQAPAEGPSANHETNARSALASPSPENSITEKGGDVNGKSGEWSVGAANADFTGTAAYNELLSDDNAQRDRPNDVRPVEVPKKDAQGRDVSEFVGNAYGSALTPEHFIPTIRRLLIEGELSYDAQTNEQTLQEAAEALAKDGDIITSVARIEENAKKGKTSARMVAEAMLLYSYLVEETDAVSQRYAANVFVSLTQLSTNSARSLQVFSLMRNMTTQGQMMAIQQTAKRSVADMVRKGIIKKDADSQIDPALMEEFRKASEDLKRIEEAERREADAQDRLNQAKDIHREADREAEKAEKRADRAETRAADAESKAAEAEKAAQAAKEKADERIGNAKERQDAARNRTKEARKEAEKAERQANREERRAERLEQKEQDTKQDAQQRKRDAEQRVKDARDAIYLHVASKQKTTFKAKWDAFRYMAMLGNVKTQIRNFVGNAGYMPYTELKRVIGTVMETAIAREKRTKSLVGVTGEDKQLREWAKADVKNENVQKALEYSAKLGDDTTLAEIRDNIRVYNWNWLEKTREFVGDVPAKTDMWFKEGEYIRSLAGFLKARGYTADDAASGKVSEATLNEGRAYAIQEALKATFNDCNKFSDALSSLRYYGDNPFLKALNIAGEGVMPFRRTPANVVVRAAENTPINALRGLVNMATKVRKGEMSAATAIDQMAAGLTGSGMMVLGWFLASGALGRIRLRGNADEEKERQGYQDYSIEIKWGDKWYSYTIDWAAPANIPLFVGANFCSIMNGENGDVGLSPVTAMIYATMNSLDPLLSLSCMSAVNDLFEIAKYAEDGTALYSAVASIATNYFTQGIPALVRQGVQAFFPNQRQTFANSSDPLIRELQRKTAGIAGVGEFFRTDKVDEWGQTESKGGWIRQVVDAFFNPGTLKEIDTRALEQEITRLNESQSESVSPPEIPKTISFTDNQGNWHQNRRLTEEEYQTLRTVQGQTAAKILNEMIASADYAALTEEQKAEAFDYAYDYAREKGRVAAFEGEYDGMDSWMEGIEGKESGAIIQKVAGAAFTGAFDSLTAAWNNGIDPSGAVEKVKEAYSVYAGLSEEQRKAVAESASGRAADCIAAMDAGVDGATFTELYHTYYDISRSESYENSTQKATQWAYELQKATENGTITEEQREILKANMTISSGHTVQTEKFDAMVESGLDAEQANDLMWLLNGIEGTGSYDKETGKNNVRTVDKMEAIAGADFLSESERITAMQLYMTEGQISKMDTIMEELGISAEAYAALYRAYLPDDKKAEEIASYKALGYSEQTATAIYYMYHPKK